MSALPLRAILVLSLFGGILAPGAPLSASAHAQSPAPELGRLFYTPERRALLERQRQLNVHTRRALEGASMSLDGVVTRSSGKSTVWVNGHPSTERDSDRTGVRAEILRSHPGSAVLTPGDDAPTRIKVGEVINRGTGERDDRLGGGQVRGGPPH